ncbi:aminotransferase class I/II-fold pyridoxal phosphate-dependent enzyme [Natranaerobius thermophilus]|uniref:Aluminium resistance family protein n=1 Tax=Natranaerobius thermophilus (strain ATCC BAA-1301 / DSM 18059 / JW/NM-WN-LF) TaxID=457570 RepID=B2A3Y3_NATTJ|nr:methionine gamma-lyase family protein [Natranaerobius thermophilus]ACB85085.1 Aluminium resistance family protein [Natranaerobius thermophilus JW/NM-WN-LF]
MLDYIKKSERWDINEDVLNAAEKVMYELTTRFSEIDNTCASNQLKVINAMQELGLSEHHFSGSTGYGYGDLGREFVDDLMARVMGTEDALVRHLWVSGTHTIYSCLASLLNQGDTLLSVTGRPYDTLAKLIGITQDAPSNSLIEQGINYKEVSLTEGGLIDYQAVNTRIKELQPEVAFIQKSRGYSSRKTLTNEDIKKLVSLIKEASPNTKIFLDNCYGEFVEHNEPGELEIDLLAGSLIKNPGGGLAPYGGYIAGKSDLVERVSYELTAPGLGRDMGATPEEFNRLFIQGLYMSPTTVASAVKGAIFSAGLFQELGYSVSPHPEDKRGDIIQEISLHNEDKLKAFITGIQKAGVVDSQIAPEPGEMPGYDCPVMMAAGTFIQGASLELSADAPLRPPYRVYQQGGLTFPHAVLGSLIAANYVSKES